MIFKPTTPEDALKNAIHAAEDAQLAVAHDVPRAEAYTRLGKLWLGITDRMPFPTPLNDDETHVTLDRDTYHVMMAIVVGAIEQHQGVTPTPFKIAQPYVRHALKQDVVITAPSPEERYWAVSLRDIVD